MKPLKSYDYTTRARAMAYRYPILAHVLIQINFWVAAFIVLNLIIYFNGMSFEHTYKMGIPIEFMPVFISGIILGIIFGLALGMTDWYMDHYIGLKLSMGQIILIRLAVYYVAIIGVTALMRFVFWEQIILVYYFDEEVVSFNEVSWRYFYAIIFTYSFAMAPVISFINQMNRKFGPGILVPMLLGKYRKPHEEERLFVFIDMQSSTTHAEKLGHLKYSALVRDCFNDINEVVYKYQAEIYQYVGDEIILSWKKFDNLKGEVSLDFFLACEEKFESHRVMYEENYGFVPRFKAGVHVGIVTIVEVGNIKRELAFHGDTLNTTARIQSVCNEYNKHLLLSKDVVDMIGEESQYEFERIGEIQLRGKEIAVQLYCLK